MFTRLCLCLHNVLIILSKVALELSFISRECQDQFHSVFKKQILVLPVSNEKANEEQKIVTNSYDHVLWH